MWWREPAELKEIKRIMLRIELAQVRENLLLKRILQELDSSRPPVYPQPISLKVQTS